MPYHVRYGMMCSLFAHCANKNNSGWASLVIAVTGTCTPITSAKAVEETKKGPLARSTRHCLPPPLLRCCEERGA